MPEDLTETERDVKTNTEQTRGSSRCYRVGNTSGRWFTQWRMDLLAELLGYVADGFCGSGGVDVEDAEIWYDDREDFHCLRFQSNGHDVLVRLYKALSYTIDGVDRWMGCPRSQAIEFAGSIRKAVSR